MENGRGEATAGETSAPTLRHRGASVSVGASVGASDGGGPHGTFQDGDPQAGSELHGKTGHAPRSTAPGRRVSQPYLRASVCEEDDIETQQRRSGKHHLLLLSVAANYIMMDMSNLVLYFALSSSNKGCDFLSSFSKMKTIQLGITLGWRPISGWLTDTYAQQQDKVLLVAALIEVLAMLAIILVTFMVDNFNVWILLGLQVLKAVTETQLYNSIWKIFKLRLSDRYRVRCGVQCSILSSVGLWGEVSELFWNMATCTLAYLMIEKFHSSFEAVRAVYMVSASFATLACLYLAWLITARGNYFRPFTEEELPSFLVHVDPEAGKMRVKSTDSAPGLAEDAWDTQRINDGRSSPIPVEGLAVPLLSTEERRGSAVVDTPLSSSVSSDSSSPGSPSANDPLTLKAQLVSSHPPPSVSPKRAAGEASQAGLFEAVVRVLRYARRSSVYLYEHPIASRMIVHQLLVYIPYSIYANAEYFAVPGHHTSKHGKTTENFCGGYLTNMSYQDMFMNAIYIAGGFYYILVLKRVLPVQYYRKWFPVMALLLGAASLVLWFKLSQLLLSLSVSTLIAMLWFLFVYDNYLAVAAIDKDYYGFYSIVYGYIQTGTDLLVYLFMYLKISNDIFLVVAHFFLALAIAYSMYFGWVYHHGLTTAGKGYC